MSRCSDKILTRLSEKNMSYGELSRRTGIPKSALQRYAVGETEKIPVDRLEQIAYALDTTPVELMDWESDSRDNSMYGNHAQNLLYFQKNQELLELYKEIYGNQTLALLFETTRDLAPSDLEMVLTIINGIRKERGLD